MPTTKIVYNDAYLTDYPTASVEKPQRVEAIHRELSSSGYPFVEARPADELRRAPCPLPEPRAGREARP